MKNYNFLVNKSFLIYLLPMNLWIKIQYWITENIEIFFYSNKIYA
jgi:hypothetical protein